MINNEKFFEHPPLLHVGYPKCLSKWLQKNLFTPENGFIKQLNPDLVHDLITSKRSFKFDKQLVQKKLDFAKFRALKSLPDAQARNLIPVVTSEALVGNLFCGGFDAELIAGRLFTTFPEAKILIVIREQNQIIRSLYSTAVAWGLPHKIRDFINPSHENIVPQFNLDFLRYDALVNHYQKLFTKERVLVIPYELFQNDPLSFIKKILELYPHLDISNKISALPFEVKTNKGQTLIETKFHRIINSWFLRTPFNYSGWFKDRPTWRQRRNTCRVHLKSASIIEKIMSYNFRRAIKSTTINSFAESNCRLEKLTGLDLGALGYET